MSIEMEYAEDIQNPLDNVEDVLSANNWIFDRMNDDEIIVEIAGRSCGYKLFFIWQEDMHALQFCCQYDLDIDTKNSDMATKILSHLNENLWMGHFEIPDGTKKPAFRHTCLMRGMHQNAGSYIEDLVDISMAQCERHFASFHLLSSSAFEIANDETLSLAMMESAGES